VAFVLRLSLAALLALFVAAEGAPQDRIHHFGAKAAAMGGAFTAVADDVTAFYWNPAGYAFGPAVHAGVQWGESEMEREGDATFLDGATGFAIGLTFMGVAGTFSDEASSTVEGDALSSRGLESFDLSVSILQSLPLDDLVLAGSVHYLRGEAHELTEPLSSLSARDLSASSVRDRVLAAGGLSSSTASLDLGALYQPRDWVRVGLLWRRLFEPAFLLPSGEELVLPRHGRAGAAFFLAHETTVSFDFDISSQGPVEDPFREISLGAEKVFFDDALAIRGGLRAEAGSDEGARLGFSAGVGLRVRFLVAEVAYQGSSGGRDEALLFAATISP
jgi:hypothetical protein